MSIVCEKSHSVDRRLICGLLCGTSSHSLSPNFLSSSSCFVLCSVVFFLTRRIYTYWLLLLTHQSILYVELFDCLTGWLSRYVYKRKSAWHIYLWRSSAGRISTPKSKREKYKKRSLFWLSSPAVLYIYIPCAAAVRACVMWRTISFTMTSFTCPYIISHYNPVLIVLLRLSNDFNLTPQFPPFVIFLSLRLQYIVPLFFPGAI